MLFQILRRISIRLFQLYLELRKKVEPVLRDSKAYLTGFQFFIFAGAILLVIAGLTWVNYRFTRENPGGNDFIPRWLGTRLFLTEGLSPYSEEASRQIQEVVFGRPARPGEDLSYFVYPLYSVYVFAPFALVEDFALARAIWMTALEISLFLMAGVSIFMTRWRTPLALLAVLLIFTALWYHSIRPLVNGNPAIVVALFITCALAAIQTQHDFLAGFLLALATIKPQMVVLLIPFVLLWAVSQGRWNLIWGFLISLVFLAVSVALLIPDWPLQNLRQIIAYPEYTLPGSPGAIFAEYLPGVGRQLGWALTILLSAVLIVEWRAAFGQDFRWFFWTAGLTLAATNLIGIRTATANYIALYPVLILVLAAWNERWGRAGRWLTLAALVILFFGLWGLFLATVQTGEQPVQSPVMFFPLPIFLILCLYWVRWWAIRPPRSLLDQFRRTSGVMK